MRLSGSEYVSLRRVELLLLKGFRTNPPGPPTAQEGSNSRLSGAASNDSEPFQQGVPGAVLTAPRRYPISTVVYPTAMDQQAASPGSLRLTFSPP